GSGMPSGNLSAMSQPATNQQRTSIVYQYRISGLSQDAFCEQLRASQGIQLAPRTLRAWSLRFGQPEESDAESAEIVAQAVRMLQGVLERLQVSHREAATEEASHIAARAAFHARHQQTPSGETSRVAAGAASSSEQPLQRSETSRMPRKASPLPAHDRIRPEIPLEPAVEAHTHTIPIGEIEFRDDAVALLKNDTERNGDRCVV